MHSICLITRAKTYTCPYMHTNKPEVASCTLISLPRERTHTHTNTHTCKCTRMHAPVRTHTRAHTHIHTQTQNTTSEDELQSKSSQVSSLSRLTVSLCPKAEHFLLSALVILLSLTPCLQRMPIESVLG